MKKKILALIGIRSEYDILYPLLKEFEKQNFEIAVAVSSAHLSDNLNIDKGQIFNTITPGLL